MGTQTGAKERRLLTSQDQPKARMIRPPLMRADTVLIVEDDESTRQVLRHVLDAAGFECRLASDGDEGVRLAFEYRPDVILMDLSMPKLSGLEALAEIRQDYRARATPVVLLTANGHVASVVEHLAAGADDYLVKPVAPRSSWRASSWPSSAPRCCATSTR